MEFFLGIVRTIAFVFDRLIYGMIPRVYNLIVDVSILEIFKQHHIENFTNSIYVLLGVFMLFKLAFSLLTTIVNPDLLNDEKQGFTNIVQRSMVALALIVLIPTIFTYAMRLQSTLISRENNIFMKLFAGAQQHDVTAGQYMGEVTLSTFLTCSDDVPAEDNCENNLAGLLSDVTNLSLMHEKLNDKISGGSFIYNYSMLFSLISGGFVLIMLLVFSLDIAMRTVKLGFLQMVAPIAVISYIDPKASESGFFSKWLKASTNTYLILFFRIAAIAFMVFVISLVPEIWKDLDKEGNESSAFVVILIIIGILLFAKDAPKMIADLFGIEDVGMGTLGKALKGAAVGATGLALGGAAMGAGALIGGATGLKHGGTLKSALYGSRKGIKSGVSGVYGAKGNVLGQAKAAFASPYGTVGEVGKAMKGEDHKWGFSKWQANMDEGVRRDAYKLEMEKEKEKYSAPYTAIEAAGEKPYTSGITPEAIEADKVMAGNLGSPSDTASIDENLKKINKIQTERNMYANGEFRDAFAAKSYSDLKLENLEKRAKIAQVKFENNEINDVEYRKTLDDHASAAKAAKAAGDKFDSVKKDHRKDSEKHDGIRSYKGITKSPDPFKKT